jgi:glutamate/tyrosine decarboxylase-like PLP-dependent enzyme
MIEQNVAQARYLADRVRATPALDLLAPVPLNIVCFRFTAPDLAPDALDRVNEEILLRVQESGAAVPSSTRIAGQFAVRCAIVNHRTRRADVDRLVD